MATHAMVIRAAAVGVLMCLAGCSTTDDNLATSGIEAAAPVAVSSTMPPTTSAPATTEQPTTTSAADVPADVAACTQSVWGTGITDAGIDPSSSFSGGGQTANCVIIDDAGNDWVVALTFGGMEWTNDAVAELFDPEWFPVTQSAEFNYDDGIWFEPHPESCRTSNGATICDFAQPLKEQADTFLVCGGEQFNIRSYSLEGVDEPGPTVAQYQAIQGEVFAKVCPTYVPS